jgi:hypothetical protein
VRDSPPDSSGQLSLANLVARGSAASYDAKGNLTADPTSGNGYVYTSENLLKTATTAAGNAGFTYDPLGRRPFVAGLMHPGMSRLLILQRGAS